jgi:hypothetical protein
MNSCALERLALPALPVISIVVFFVVYCRLLFVLFSLAIALSVLRYTTLVSSSLSCMCGAAYSCAIIYNIEVYYECFDLDTIISGSQCIISHSPHSVNSSPFLLTHNYTLHRTCKISLKIPKSYIIL